MLLKAFSKQAWQHRAVTQFGRRDVTVMGREQRFMQITQFNVSSKMVVPSAAPFCSAAAANDNTRG